MKKGFSLIELLVSLIIISIVVVFISAFVLNLRDEKESIAIDVPAYINQAAISRTLNYDAIENGGITSVSITNNGKTCSISYVNHKTGTVKINSSGDTLTYTLDGVVEFVRTLTGTKRFTVITAANDTSTYSPKTLFKYIITMNDGNNIEVVSYAAPTSSSSCTNALKRAGTDASTGLSIVKICNEEFYDITNAISYSSLISTNGNIYNYSSGKSILLAKYSLYVGKIRMYSGTGSNSTEILPSEIGYGLQSEYAKGHINNLTPRVIVGVVPFCGSENYYGYWDPSNTGIYSDYGTYNYANNIYDVNYVTAPNYDYSFWSDSNNANYSIAYYVNGYVNKLKSQNGLPSSASGRLLTYTEAQALNTSYRSIVFNGSSYWLGTAYSSTKVNIVYNYSNSFEKIDFNGDSSSGVRPVLIVNTSDIETD